MCKKYAAAVASFSPSPLPSPSSLFLPPSPSCVSCRCDLELMLRLQYKKHLRKVLQYASLCPFEFVFNRFRPTTGPLSRA